MTEIHYGPSGLERRFPARNRTTFGVACRFFHTLIFALSGLLSYSYLMMIDDEALQRFTVFNLRGMLA